MTLQCSIYNSAPKSYIWSSIIRTPFLFSTSCKAQVACEKKILKKFVKKKFWKNLFQICLAYNPWVSTKSFSPFGPAVWPAIRNICTNVLFYYIEIAVSLNNWQAHIRIKQFLSQKNDGLFPHYQLD